jgi:hypothetical protein
MSAHLTHPFKLHRPEHHKRGGVSSGSEWDVHGEDAKGAWYKVGTVWETGHGWSGTYDHGPAGEVLIGRGYGVRGTRGEVLTDMASLHREAVEAGLGETESDYHQEWRP